MTKDLSLNAAGNVIIYCEDPGNAPNDCNESTSSQTLLLTESISVPLTLGNNLPQLSEKQVPRTNGNKCANAILLSMKTRVSAFTPSPVPEHSALQGK